MTKKQTNCKYCGGKGYYSYLYGIIYRADFIGDKEYSEPFEISLIACHKCNKNNKLKLKGVKKDLFDRLK
jgi:hypothetical protein